MLERIMLGAIGIPLAISGMGLTLSFGVFVFIGLIPNTQFLQGSSVKLDPRGHIITNEKLETSMPGVFASRSMTRSKKSGASPGCAYPAGRATRAVVTLTESNPG